MKLLWKLCLHLFGILLWSLMIVAVIQGADNVAAKFSAGDDAVSIQATITRVDKRTDFDEGMEQDYWQSYVSYDYNGQHYSNVYYDQTHSEPKVGTTVTVQIDPENPDELLLTPFEFILSMVMPPLFLLAIVGVAYLYLQYLIETLSKGKWDERPEEARPFKKIAYSLTTGLLILGNILYYTQKQHLVFAAFSLFALALLSFILYRSHKKAPTADQPQSC